MSKVTRKDGKGKPNQINFEGKSCLIGFDAHKASYAVAILDEEGQRLEFSTVAAQKKLCSSSFGVEFIWNTEATNRAMTMPLNGTI